MNIAQALAQAHGLGLDRLEAQALMLHALGRDLHDRAWLLAHDTDALPADRVDRFRHMARRRAAGDIIRPPARDPGDPASAERPPT